MEYIPGSSFAIRGKRNRGYYLVFSLLFTFLLYMGLWAQETDFKKERSLFYPTLISTRYRDGAVEIDFEPLNKKGFVYKLYRSSAPLHDEAALSEATLLGEVTEDQLPMIDVPEKDGQYFYAVTALKKEREYINIVPYQNSTVHPIDFSPFPQPVQDIDIKQTADNTITIYFDKVQEVSDTYALQWTYHLYVSKTLMQDVQDQKPVASIKGEELAFVFTVKEDRPYFFVITSVNRLNIENRKIITGENQNREPFLVKKTGRKPSQSVAARPKERASDLIENNLRHNFYRGRYESALKSFFELLKGGRLSRDQKASVHFYVGQCYFYLGNIPKAIKYFILSKEVKHYIERADAWIERALEMIE